MGKVYTPGGKANVPALASSPFGSLTASGASIQTRQLAEIQARVACAMQMPRDPNRCVQSILVECGRLEVAEASRWAFQRGLSQLSGPSIRLAEVIAQNWPHLEWGIRELAQTIGARPGEGSTEMEAYAWDLQTNNRQSRCFTVPHWEKTKSGRRLLDDPRDIYEYAANMGSRRVRACLEAVIPAWVWTKALDACDATVAARKSEKLTPAKVDALIKAFASAGVTEAQLEAYLRGPVRKAEDAQLHQLRPIYVAIRDGEARIEDHFQPDVAKPVPKSRAKSAPEIDPDTGEEVPPL